MTRGRKPKLLTEELIPKIVEGYKATFTLKRAAFLAGTTPYHLRKWMELGQVEAEECQDTLNAQLYLKVGKQLSEIAKAYLEIIRTNVKNNYSLQWKLERCFRDDYGIDAHLIDQLVERIEKLEQSMKQPDYLQGVSNG